MGRQIGSVQEKDLTQDGKPELIYKFDSGKTLILVTNYGDKIQTGEETYEDFEQVPHYGTKQECGTKQEAYQDTVPDNTAKNAAYQRMKKAEDEVELYVDPDIGLVGGGLGAYQKAKEEWENTPVYSKEVTKYRTVTDYSNCETVTDYSNVTYTDGQSLGMKTRPIMEPAADWDDVDADGNDQERSVGYVVFKDDPKTRNIETYDVPKYTIVIEDKPAPPPPPPPPPPRKIEKSSKDELLRGNGG